MLCVVDGHDNFPVLSLRLLRADHTSTEFPSSKCAEWSVVSGGGGGNVAQWSILGLAGETQEEGQEAEAAGTISLFRTGEYKVRVDRNYFAFLRTKK